MAGGGGRRKEEAGKGQNFRTFPEEGKRGRTGRGCGKKGYGSLYGQRVRDILLYFGRALLPSKEGKCTAEDLDNGEVFFKAPQKT